ncbi:hypothetical protein AAHE18_03G134200 [Arachis hypogaea]
MWETISNQITRDYIILLFRIQGPNRSVITIIIQFENIKSDLTLWKLRTLPPRLIALKIASEDLTMCLDECKKRFTEYSRSLDACKKRCHEKHARLNTNTENRKKCIQHCRVLYSDPEEFQICRQDCLSRFPKTYAESRRECIDKCLSRYWNTQTKFLECRKKCYDKYPITLEF